MLSGAIQGVPEKSFLYKGQHPEEKKTVVLLDFVQITSPPYLDNLYMVSQKNVP